MRIERWRCSHEGWRDAGAHDDVDRSQIQSVNIPSASYRESFDYALKVRAIAADVPWDGRIDKLVAVSEIVHGMIED